MARALSQVYTVIRGSVGGVTYLANQFHQIIVRARTAPVDPSTTNQAIMRSAVAEANATWRSMLQSVRDLWDNWAQNVTFNGPLGNYTVPGRQLFVMARAMQTYLINKWSASITQVVTPPSYNNLYLLGSMKIRPPAAPGTGFKLEVNSEDLEDGFVHTVISAPFALTRNRFKGPFLSESGQATAITAGGQADIEYVGLTSGQAYFVRVRAVSDAAGPRTSKVYYVRAIAVAGV